VGWRFESPGSPLTSPKRFTFHRFDRPPGVAADSELRTSENKTLATRSARIPLLGGDAVSVQVQRHLEIRLSPLVECG
jgi:hypothetical protein